MSSPIHQLDAPPASRMDSPNFNIAAYLPEMARRVPDQAAVIVTTRYEAGQPVYEQLTFEELERLSNRYAAGLASVGFERGMRTLLMVKPGVDFVAVVFALFKIGAVPVMIDPGMGTARMLECIRDASPEGFVGIPLAHAVRIFKRRAFRTVRCAVTVGRRWFWGGPTLDQLASKADVSFPIAETRGDETAAILFTSGSTGPAKGVVYEHGMFDAQVRMIQRHYGIEPGEVDLPAFPLFALFSTAMGMTSVIPDMDASHPARVDPTRIIRAVRDHQVTNTFGSPAIWKKVAAYSVSAKVELPSLRRILIAGAPVPPEVIEQLQKVMNPDADVHTPYGATESLPVTSISGREILRDCVDKTRCGAGTCVGKPLLGCELRIIRITDEPIPIWSDDLTVPDPEKGEIVVSGPMVTKAYHGLPEATAAAKIKDGDKLWHRIGDIGYRDASGSIWFCGRKNHRVITERGTMFTVPCEAIFNEHREVSRCALVGVGPRTKQRPVIVIEPKSADVPCGDREVAFKRELLDLAKSSELTRDIRDVLFHRSLPVDVRHNAKINREELAVWAAGRRS